MRSTMNTKPLSNLWQTRKYHRRLPAFVAALGLCVPPLALAQGLSPECGTLKTGYGPYDYRYDRGETLDRVESEHFTPRVEALIRGKTGSAGQDIGYTLRAFPNHHRALLSAQLLAERDKTDKPTGMDHTVDCYFRRAIFFKPDDAVVRMLYSRFLFKAGRVADAKSQLQTAGSGKEVSPFTLYNIGLVLFDFKEYELAGAYAQRALDMGFNRPDLKNRLTELNMWPPKNPEAAGAASAPASASDTQDIK